VQNAFGVKTTVFSTDWQVNYAESVMWHSPGLAQRAYPGRRVHGLSARRLKPRQQKRQAHLRGLPTPHWVNESLLVGLQESPLRLGSGQAPGDLVLLVAANSFAGSASASGAARRRAFSGKIKIADRASVFRNDHVSFTGSAVELHDEAKLREEYV
jgi:hypothetical protein